MNNIKGVITNFNINRYLVFLTIGGIVGVITLLIRELFDIVLGIDNRIVYLLSIAFAYFIGIILSFFLHSKVTFGRKKVAKNNLFSFIVVAILGLISTMIFSFMLRYWVSFDSYFKNFGATISFGIGSILSSILTYSANAKFVFKEEKNKGDNK